MEVLLNELSLTGQFSDQDEFVRKALRPYICILREMQMYDMLLLKKSDVWDKSITPTCNIHSILVTRPIALTDEVGRFKSAIAALTKEPFWDDDSKQPTDSTYLLDKIDIKGSSPAEACERDNTIISFIQSNTSSDPLNIVRNGTNVPLLNLTAYGEITAHLWNNKKISFESYLKARFSEGKLDFSKVDRKMDFSKIRSTEHSPFLNSFENFEKLTWDQIYNDRGLNYKEYHGDIDASFRGMKTYKFRASQKFRCHGYREKDSFVVIGFETDHKLSDRG